MTIFTFPPCRAFSLGVLILVSKLAAAQTPTLLKDVYPGSEGSVPLSFVGFNKTAEGATLADVFYFTADDGVNGIELWRSDGTEAGTTLVKDIYPGAADSRPTWLTAAGNQLLFFARDSAHGLELWRSDGTESGTQLVKDINAGPDNSIRTGYAPQIRDMAVLNGVLYFSADSDGQFAQLWRSDGTEAGTYLLKAVCTDCTAASPAAGWFTIFGTNVYFIAGNDIWKSNGTAAGTVLIQNGDSYPGRYSQLRAAGNKLYFAGQQSNSVDVEPYTSDGSVGGAVLLKDVAEGNFSGSFPRQFTAFGNKVYFIANQKLWVTNGTEAGTTEFSALTTGNYSPDPGDGQNFLVANNRLFFNARPSAGSKEYLYVTDGTAANTVQLAETNSFGFSELGLLKFGQKVCFWGQQNGEIGIWITNGSAKIFYPTNTSFQAEDLWLAGEYLYFFHSPLSPNSGMEPFQLKLTPDVALSAGLVQVDSLACFGDHTASLLVEPAGGVPPYTYAWSSAALSGNNPTGLGAGTYKVTVLDAGLNTIEKTLAVACPSAITLNITAVPAVAGQSNGSATPNPNGGTPPYTYVWSNGETVAVLNNLAPGTYTLTVTDDNGCTKTNQTTIQEIIGVKDAEQDLRWSVFPAPARDQLHMAWTGDPLNDPELDLFDRHGAVVRHWNGWQQGALDVSDLPAGWYVLRLSDGRYVGRRSVMLVR